MAQGYNTLSPRVLCVAETLGTGLFTFCTLVNNSD